MNTTKKDLFLEKKKKKKRENRHNIQKRKRKNKTVINQDLNQQNLPFPSLFTYE